MLGQRRALPELAAHGAWDAVVIGGGITGAGIALEAARRGHKVLLLEQRDFSWGTSSRSSKMVHGGLRYIAQGDIQLTRHALQERERLLAELPDLVVRMPYVFPIRQGRFPGRWPMTFILKLYDALAGIRDHRWMSRDEVRQAYPALNDAGLRGAMRYTDALTDDSRLVIRVLQEAALEGARARNYTEVLDIKAQGDMHELLVQDTNTDNGARLTLHARHVFNATGLWADRLSGTPPVVRPQRGTHLFVAASRLPVRDCLTILHPDDHRPVFVFPWKGQTCIGTTDIDHREGLQDEPHCTPAEIDYLLKVANSELPALHLRREDVLATMAGVRPIIASGKGKDPSKERRDHLVWQANGVISVSGGKLTTFRQIALDALKAAGLIDAATHRQAHQGRHLRCFRHAVPSPHGLNDPVRGTASGGVLQAQVEWILTHEMVVHLDDLLLRRLRLGVLCADAGESLLLSLKPMCQLYLGWDEARWQWECTRYRAVIASSYR
ncbi:MAG: glycerol-3-phosphate dehydrogenase/oxidase [Aquabacterium sp.]|uniref:glycerol-3-phosphate dehydrogenase/oxidase n=1 Tax=Aquabacterium sp. TaxID=1872578 RepID=UPI0025BDF4DA|nr:glycerol-3-phosphate dehydrogenase/oxidase [Aquabacterium sp.]MBI3380725.1 glycerol-3-phosphate dehydrogenase/oxidase [Aquabacterium sp.]